MDRIYMDNAATTAICPEALSAMLPCFGEHFGNASSIHGTGRDARKVLEDARRSAPSNCSKYASGVPTSAMAFRAWGPSPSCWAR